MHPSVDRAPLASRHPPGDKPGYGTSIGKPIATRASHMHGRRPRERCSLSRLTCARYRRSRRAEVRLLGSGSALSKIVSDNPRRLTRQWRRAVRHSGPRYLVGADNFIRSRCERVFVDDAADSIVAVDSDGLQIGDGFWQRSEWSGLAEGAVWPVLVVVGLVVAQNPQ